MSLSTFDQREKHSRLTLAQRERLTRIFYVVGKQYAETKMTRSLLAAHSPDPDEQHSSTLSTMDINFCCDVDIANRRALANDPALLESWENLIAASVGLPGIPKVDARTAKRLIELCGRIYAAKGLHRRDYWVTIRRGPARRTA